MHDVLNNNLFLVKEHIGLFKAANNYDIYDPETREVVMQCREEKLNPLTKVLRFTKYKKMTPFDIEIRTPDGHPVVRVKRGVAFIRSRVQVLDEQDCYIGGFRQQLFKIGGAFTVLDSHERPVCELKGNWTGWEFKFTSQGEELAFVTKQWAGIGREMLTTADSYVLQISSIVPRDSEVRQLILAAVMCIDMVLKE